ncbi:TolC family protein [Helicobacter muridarum]|uniref:Outer-membrane protein of the hefABC efflux system HefA n=1 Tax=Helicobacter muridarum TaxID=216 RepID=A0A377PXA5_9HELI|nr:TolC family protein [Helicobacter muridarum]TLD98904.1 TolC family protein [Helicobacter muridarum]STQ87129.1 outer-membrane protein of the hefABC efflux system HefA [Helicobacter muridarum]
MSLYESLYKKIITKIYILASILIAQLSLSFGIAKETNKQNNSANFLFQQNIGQNTKQNRRNEVKDSNQLESVLRESGKDGITLKELLNSASNNLSLQAQNLLSEQAQKDYLVSKLALIPNLDAKYNFNHTAASTPISWQTQNAQLNLNWTLDYANFQAIKEKGAISQKNVYDVKYLKQNIYLQIVQQYYIYFNNESIIMTLQQKLQQIRSDVDRVQKLYAQGLKTISDLESLKSQASLTEYQINDAQLALTQSMLTLEYLANTKIENIKRISIIDPTYLLEDRSDIKSLEFQIKAQKHLNAQLHYYPSLIFQNTYTYNIQIPDFAKQLLMGSGGIGGFAATYADHHNSFGIILNYGLFAKIGQSVQKQSFALATIANEKILNYKKNEQKKDEELYRMAITLAKNQIESAKASLISANLSYDNMKKRYEANIVTFTEYMQALSTKYDAESTLIQALNNYETQKANYIFYSGQEIDKYIK